MSLTLHIIGFLAAAAVIVFSGTKLSKYGDMMADMMGWGKMFMGLILLAAVTSLPELMTGISAVTIVDSPDLAVGDIVGSCALNILILSILDVYTHKQKPLTSVIQTGHIIAASFAIVLLAMLGFAILKPAIFGTVIWIGGFSLLFVGVYILSMRVVFLYEKKRPLIDTHPFKFDLTLKQVVLRYIYNACLVMFAAMALPWLGEHIAAEFGISEGLFGTLFLAASTVLPEVVVSIAAVRIGAIDMAIGNLFGSTIFNIGILGLIDVLYTKGPIFLYTSPNHIVPVLSTIIFIAIAIIGIVFKSEKKWKLAMDTAAILILYIMMMVLLATLD